MRARRPLPRGLPPEFAWMLATCAANGLLALCAALARGPGGGERLAWALGVVALGLLPLPGRSGALRRCARLLLVLAQLACAWTLVGAGAPVHAALLLGLQGHALRRSDQLGAALVALALAVALAAVGVGAGGGGLGLLLLIATLVLALAAACALHGPLVRARVLRASAVGSLPEVPRRDLDGRLLQAAKLGALLAPVALLGVALGARAAAWQATSTAEETAEARERLGRGAPADGGDLAPRAGQDWTTFLESGRTVGRRSEEVVLHVRPRAPHGRSARPGALYLKALALDRFDAEGVHQDRVAELEQLRDGDDGPRDGWIELASASQEVLELQVAQRPLLLGDAAGGALVREEPLLALAAPAALYHPDRALVADVPEAGWFRYALRVPLERPRPLAGERARHGDARFTQLPPESPALERVRAEAARLAAGARDDRERVERVVAHFRRGYRYGLATSTFCGAEGAARFLDAREGFCTSFASTAALLLRTLGIPARVAGGYLAEEWSDQTRAWTVRGRNAHAWIEVHFERAGWVTCEPTPSALREALAAAGEGQGEPPGLLAWGGMLGRDVRDLVLPGERSVTPAQVLDTLAEGPPAAVRSARRHPLLAPLWLLLPLALLGLRARRRVVSTLARAGLAPAERRDASEWERLVRALERLGFARRPAQTPRELAREALRRGGASFAPLPGLTELFYRARFGGVPLSAEERARLRAFVRELELRRAGAGEAA